MGALKLTKAGFYSTIQDLGRPGYRRYGIPLSGAMDPEWMVAAQMGVGNPENYPAIEFAVSGMVLEAIEETQIAVAGAQVRINKQKISKAIARLQKGDLLEVSSPTYNYGYLAIGGLLDAQKDFGSYSTYLPARFGGLHGTLLKNGDLLTTSREIMSIKKMTLHERKQALVAEIKIMKGPEWNVLKELPSSKNFTIDPASDRMGIRLKGDKLEADITHIYSSAVVPGTIQLPTDGHPIILMNDCQTTGGYPRIGQVVASDLAALAQVRPGRQVRFVTY